MALSGGGDSVALLHLLCDPELSLHLTAVHVHHGTRGAEADRDAEFCRRLCTGLGVAFRLVHLDAGLDLGDGREAAWRAARYQALLEAAREADAAAVATAHHRDDITEGVLVQLLRGAGPRALAGISEATGDGIIRPLLPWHRQDIRTWLEQRNLAWCEDSSNRASDHLRNVVRDRLLPTLEEASPRLRDHLVRLARALAADDEFLSDQLARSARFIDPWHPRGGVPVQLVRYLAPALRSRWLLAQAHVAEIGKVTARQLELFECLITRGTPRAVTLAGRWRLRRARHQLWLEPPNLPEATVSNLGPGQEVALGVPGWMIRVVDEAIEEPPVEWRTTVPGTENLRVRGCVSDDTVAVEERMVGVPRLIAAQLPRHLRNAWPVVTVGDTITWIPGVWQDESHRGPGRVVVEVVRR